MTDPVLISGSLKPHFSGSVRLRALLELTKPITWFPPIWAFGCGLVASGISWQTFVSDRGVWLLLGLVLAGPAVCGTSQIINDWFDRHVDAINEPHRPIPSGRIPGHWGLWFALLATVLSAGLAWILGPVTFGAALVGLAAAWAYSAPPFRFKRSGWTGPAVVGLCYEGLPWITATAIAVNGVPQAEVWIVAILYSVGAHGIMTLNDFKAIEGDTRTGLQSLPVQLGVRMAGLVACATMIVPQATVCALMLVWGFDMAAFVVGLLVLAQSMLMRRLLRDPARYAPWYGANGVSLYVLGMMTVAVFLGQHIDISFAELLS